MWVLYNKQNQPIYHLPLIHNQSYIVGRKCEYHHQSCLYHHINTRLVGECDILLDKDKSISRKHTVLTVKEDNSLEFEDFSKYGTELNQRKLKGKVTISPQATSTTVKFGIYDSILTYVKTMSVDCYH
jgi:hypothetical protein